MRSVTIVPAFMNPIGTYFCLSEETRLRLIQYCYTSFYSRLGKFLRNLFPMNTKAAAEFFCCFSVMFVSEE